MTIEQIEKINKECPEDQGIFVEPYGIDTKIKEAVVYMRWNTGGMKGGSYHIDSYRHPYEGTGRPDFYVLKLILHMFGIPEFKANSPKITEITRDNNYSDTDDYYGNYDDYSVEYIVLSELESILSSL